VRKLGVSGVKLRKKSESLKPKENPRGLKKPTDKAFYRRVSSIRGKFGKFKINKRFCAMRSQPKISIIVPTHNRRQFLEATINSVRAQSITNWELIVIDDASDDETWPWLRQLQNSQIKTFRLEQHSERTAGRNWGLEAAKGEFVLFLDDDDLLPVSALQAHLESFQRHPSASGSVGCYMMFDENGAQQTFRYFRRRRLHDIWPDLLFGHIPVFGQCLFRAAVIKSAGGWDGEFIPIEDHQLWLRIAPHGRVVMLPEVVLHYRVHAGQWRPRKLWKLMTRVRQRAVKKLEGERRKHAERIMQAREHFREGEIFSGDGEAARALRSYLKAVRLQPGILRSPLTRAMIMPPIMKCLVGERLANRQQPQFARARVVDYHGEEQAVHSRSEREASASQR